MARATYGTRRSGTDTCGSSLDCASFELLDRVALQVFEVDELEYGHVGRIEHDFGSHIRFQGFLPSQNAQAPSVAFAQSGKIVLLHRSAQVITAFFRKFKKGLSNLDANRVHSQIFGAGVAASVAKESGHRVDTAHFQVGAQDIFGSTHDTFQFLRSSRTCFQQSPTQPLALPPALSLAQRVPTQMIIFSTASE